ncbi:MAG: metalloregulator ArsR/SmtB family transcription factor [Chloroflexi bacterium]|nr:ArsR family transcriptional regulator [Chloroflexota bacterium]NOG65684.1 metalloregulator ArsR/SmtB family transcription factor [Chloroflexota bacterium]
MNHRDFKTALNEQFARIAKAVANPHRIEILDILAQGERSVEAIAHEANLTIGNASQHLQGLREAHLISSRKQGLHVYYRLADPSIFRLIQVIRDIAEAQLAEVNRLVESYFTNRKSLEPVTLNELYARLHEPDLVVLDVRPSTEYAQGHIPRARSIPVDELEQRLSELAPEQEIVAYCRGAYCVFADEAVELLSAHGYQVRRLQEGYPDWLLAQLPTETNE